MSSLWVLGVAQLNLPAESELYKCEQEATEIVVMAEGTSGIVERSKELKWGHSRVKRIFGCVDRDSRAYGWFWDTTEVDLDGWQSGTDASTRGVSGQVRQ